MPDQPIQAGRQPQEGREAVRIHTRQIQDACIDKDCIEDLRVYLTTPSQTALEGAVSARARNAELLHVYIDVQPIPYNPGHYTADLTFCYRVTGEALAGALRPTALEGLALFTKRVVLYGGEQRAKIFSSADNQLRPDALYQVRTPDCLVEAVDPMVLSSHVAEAGDQNGALCPEVPQGVRALFPEDLALGGSRQLYVTLGQFSTVRMERSTQALVAALRPIPPDRSCSDDPGTPDEPCDLFARVDFPRSAFYPN